MASPATFPRFRQPLPGEGPTDADLVHAFARSPDEADRRLTLAALVDRHGSAVLRVCRSQLREPADQDDAFQATFLVFVRDCRRVRDPALLGAWLVRVATLICLKARRDTARRRVEPLATEPAGQGGEPIAAAQEREQARTLWAELDALPAKWRAVLVLCGIEGRTNREAASLLGVPVGTVDSRLAAAKTRLRLRLARRGVAATLLALAEGMAGPELGATVPPLLAAQTLAWLGRTWPAGVPVILLTQGVGVTMLTTARIVVLGLMALTLIGGTGIGIYQGVAQDGSPKAAKPAPDKGKPGEKGADEAKKPTEQATFQLAVDETEVRARLSVAPAKAPETMGFGAFLRHLRDNHGITVVLDTPSLERAGMRFPLDYRVYEQKVRLDAPFYPTVEDMLLEVLPQIDRVWKPNGEAPSMVFNSLTYRIVGNHIRLGPAYKLLTLSKEQEEIGGEFLEQFKGAIKEQRYGPVLSISFHNTSLTQAVELLRKKTGANIVLDPRLTQNAEQPPPPITASFDDVRLLTILEVIAATNPIQGEVPIKPVSMGNVFYITTVSTAERLQKQADLDVYGPRKPRPAAPPGGLQQLFPGGAPGVGGALGAPVKP